MPIILSISLERIYNVLYRKIDTMLSSEDSSDHSSYRSAQGGWSIRFWKIQTIRGLRGFSGISSKEKPDTKVPWWYDCLTSSFKCFKKD